MYNAGGLGVFTYPNMYNAQPCNTWNDELPSYFGEEMEYMPGDTTNTRMI